MASPRPSVMRTLTAAALATLLLATPALAHGDKAHQDHPKGEHQESKDKDHHQIPVSQEKDGITLSIHNLQVDGIRCHDCVKQVQDAVLKVPGVTAFEIAKDNKSVRVKADPKVTVDQIVAAVKKAGYDPVKK